MTDVRALFLNKLGKIGSVLSVAVNVLISAVFAASREQSRDALVNALDRKSVV